MHTTCHMMTQIRNRHIHFKSSWDTHASTKSCRSRIARKRGNTSIKLKNSVIQYLLGVVLGALVFTRKKATCPTELHALHQLIESVFVGDGLHCCPIHTDLTDSEAQPSDHHPGLAYAAADAHLVHVQILASKHMHASRIVAFAGHLSITRRCIPKALRSERRLRVPYFFGIDIETFHVSMHSYMQNRCCHELCSCVTPFCIAWQSSRSHRKQQPILHSSCPWQMCP